MKLPLRPGVLAYITKGQLAGRAVTLNRLATPQECVERKLSAPYWFVKCATALMSQDVNGTKVSSYIGIAREACIAPIAGPEFNWLLNVKEEKKP